MKIVLLLSLFAGLGWAQFTGGGVFPPGATGGGATNSGALTDSAIARTSGTVATIGTSCATTPCNYRFGSSVFPVASAATYTISAGTGTVYTYIDGSTHALTVGHNAFTLVCSAACTAATPITAYPDGSIPIGRCTVTSGVIDVGGCTDDRSIYSLRNVAAGTGLSGSTVAGLTTLSIDTTAYYKGIIVTPTVLADLGTWFNQGAEATVTAVTGGWDLAGGIGASTATWHGRTKAIPATPFTFGVCFDAFIPAKTFAGVGLGFGDGTKLKVIFQGVNVDNSGPSTGAGYYFSNSTTFVSALVNTLSTQNITGFQCFAVSDGGVNWHYLSSSDGVNWTLLGTEARNTSLTATTVGVFIQDATAAGNATIMKVRSLFTLTSAL